MQSRSVAHVCVCGVWLGTTYCFSGTAPYRHIRSLYKIQRTAAGRRSKIAAPRCAAPGSVGQRWDCCGCWRCCYCSGTVATPDRVAPVAAGDTATVAHHRRHYHWKTPRSVQARPDRAVTFFGSFCICDAAAVNRAACDIDTSLTVMDRILTSRPLHPARRATLLFLLPFLLVTFRFVLLHWFWVGRKLRGGVKPPPGE